MAADHNRAEPETIPSGAAPVSLSDTTARGFAWFFAQTVGGKLVAVFAQILLARILVPEEFGAVSLALAFGGFACIFQQLNLSYALIQRPADFPRLANAVFWMSLAGGCLSALALLVCAPLAGHIYHSTTIAGLLLVLAVNQPLNSLVTVHIAMLQIQLRFRELAVLNLGVAVSTSVLSVGLAWMGMGAYAMLLPLPIVNLLRLAYVLTKARPPIRLHPHLQFWRELFGTGVHMIGIYFFWVITATGDYIILGLFFPNNKEIVGTYYFAFNLSIQLLALVSVNLAGTLIPVLSRLQHDPSRQIRAFIRVSAVTAMIAVPIFIYQAALSGPLIRLVFGAKWTPAIPLLQALSVAMALQCIAPLTLSLLQAQRRLGECVRWLALLALVFVVLVAIGSRLGAAFGCALAVIVFSIVSGPGGVFVAIRQSGGGLRNVARVYGWPLLLSLATAGIPAAVAHALGIDQSDLGLAAVVIVPGVATYVLLARRFMPEQWAEAVSRFPRLGGRLRRPGTGIRDAV